MRTAYRARAGASPWRSTPVMTLASMGIVLAAAGALWYLGILNLSVFNRRTEPNRAGMVPVPIAARAVPAYTRLTRDHFWDPAASRLTVVYLPASAVTKDVMVNMRDMLGRVLDHDKAPGYVFTEDDFLPKGTREGIVAGIPAGKRAIRVPAEKVEGLYGLRIGDRFDLIATLAIDSGGRGGAQNFNFGGVYGPQLALQARLSNWQKQATVRVLAQNAVIVEPLVTRQVPVFSSSLTQAGVTRMRPVQEIVIAVDPDEVASLTEAMAVDAKISTVPRSGRPDDPAGSRTPGLTPVTPFTGPTTAGGPEHVRGSEPFAVVETITGPSRALTAVPQP